MTKLDVEALDELLERSFPQVRGFSRIEALGTDSIRLRVPFSEDHLRPGGTVSGPTLMAAADLAVYLLLLSRIGDQLLAVTTHLNIHFLRKPAPADVIAEARLLKLGTRLAIGEVLLRSEGLPELVAQATVTYAIPRTRP